MFRVSAPAEVAPCTATLRYLGWQWHSGCWDLGCCPKHLISREIRKVTSNVGFGGTTDIRVVGLRSLGDSCHRCVTGLDHQQACQSDTERGGYGADCVDLSMKQSNEDAGTSKSNWLD